MALLTTHSNATNKYTSTALCIRYAASDVVYTSIPTAHEVHRYATKTYGYGGMTYAAAVTCATAKRTKYTRTRKYWKYENGAFSYVSTTRLQAEVTVVHDAGHMWHVDVQVNEDDVAYCIGNLPADLSTLFAGISDTNYDEGTGEDA